MQVWQRFGVGIGRNEQQHLVVGGCDALDLVGRYGTPLYVYDEEGVRGRCRRWRESLARHWPQGEVIYASKAFLPMAMAALAYQEGLGLDVSSGGELWTALQAGVPPSRLYFQGNGKSWDELELALEAGVGRIVVDNADELGRLHLLGARMGRKVHVLLRVTPGVDAGAHDHISTGKFVSKFGFVPGPDLETAVARARQSPHLVLRGLACHVGSQILDLEPFRQAARAIVEVAAQFSWPADWELDLGGGLGVVYTEADQPPPIEDVVKTITTTLREGCGQRGIPLPQLILEPGRSVVAESGVALYTVNAVKEVPGRKYAVVDGGIHDNPRPALYGAEYAAALAGRLGDAVEGRYWVVGKNCESSDVLAKEVPLPSPRPGEVLALFTCGAYQYAMASNYNRMVRPAVVFAAGGQADLVVARETYRDLLRQDVLPERLCLSSVAASASS